MSRSLQAQFSYTVSHAIDDSSNDMGFGGGFASLFGAGQRGSADYDVRHNANFSGSWRLPAPRGLAAAPIRDWFVDFVVAARTGLPFDVQGVSSATSDTDTTTTSAGGLFAQVRPDYTGQPIWISDPRAPGGKKLNRDAFVVPTGYAQGNLGRNALRGFGMVQADLALRRMISISERWKFHIAAQGYNILNHPNFSNPSPLEGANMSSPNFGVATRMLNQGFGGGVNPLYRSGGPRSMELMLRLQF
jgi:hypothetical protein